MLESNECSVNKNLVSASSNFINMTTFVLEKMILKFVKGKEVTQHVNLISLQLHNQFRSQLSQWSSVHLRLSFRKNADKSMTFPTNI